MAIEERYPRHMGLRKGEVIRRGQSGPGARQGEQKRYEARGGAGLELQFY